jgi:hypothetical protein
VRLRLPYDPVARLALLVASWAVTRVLLVVLTRARELYPAQHDAFDLVVFEAWGRALAGGDGPVPLRDGPWEYPAGAAPLLVGPALLRGAPYVLGFVGQMVLVDLALLLLLALWGSRRGSLAGAWFWVAAAPLLGPVVLARFDLVPTLLAAGGLVAAAVRAPLAAGVLLATGAAVKLWPALLVPLVLVLHGGSWRWWAGRLLAGAALVGVAVVAAVAGLGGLPHLLSFLRYQQQRGLEVESLPALPLMAARAAGAADVEVFFAFGSHQVDGPGADLLLLLADLGLLLVLALVAVLAWRVRRRGADPAQATVVLAVALMTGVLVTDKVLSPQYPVWVAGLVALALCWPDSPLRDAVLPLGAALLLTQLVYPLTFSDLLDGAAGPVRLLAARDVLLVVVLAQASWAAWRMGSVDPPPAAVDQRGVCSPAEASGPYETPR